MTARLAERQPKSRWTARDIHYEVTGAMSIFTMIPDFGRAVGGDETGRVDSVR